MDLKWVLVALMAMLSGGTDFGIADEWPQWRGGDLTSVSSENDLPTVLDQEKNMLWRVPLPGSAGSSPVVWGDHAFVTSADDNSLVLICIDIAKGEIKWKKLFDGQNEIGRQDGANSASPSPSTDGQHVWAMMGNGMLACYTVDGELEWKKDLQKEYGEFDIQFGMSSTPILDHGNLYLALMHGDMRSKKKTSVGQVIALDAKSGNEIWVHLRKTDAVSENTHGYASPTLYRNGGVEMLITHGADYVIGHSLNDGSELWRCGGFNPQGDSYNRFLRLVASPSCGDGIIVAPTAKRGPVLGLKPNLEGDVTADDSARHWELSQGTPDVATPLIYDGHVYLAGERGVMTCLDVKSGDVKYRERLMSDRHRSTPVAANGNIYITGRKGTVFVIKAGPKLEVVSENNLKEETTSSPAISNGRVFIRTYQALYAFGKKD